jgi:large subunit ribosomal protein L9
MKIILNKDVRQLGDEGDIKDVTAGYARNYLFPQNLAMPFSKHGLEILNQKKAKIEANKARKIEEAKSLKERLDGYSLTITRPAGENGKLFGAVTNATIAELLNEDGMAIERKQIGIPQNAIKIVGEFDVKVKLIEKEVAHIKVTVKSEADEKAAAKKSAKAVAESTVDTTSTEEPSDYTPAETATESVVEETATAEPDTISETPAEEASEESGDEEAVDSEESKTEE